MPQEKLDFSIKFFLLHRTHKEVVFFFLKRLLEHVGCGNVCSTFLEFLNICGCVKMYFKNMCCICTPRAEMTCPNSTVIRAKFKIIDVKI
jgi:hypothetical protein